MIIETLAKPASDYEIKYGTESKIIPGVSISLEALYECPRCKKRLKLIHSLWVTCPSCGLDVAVFGNAMKIREDQNEKESSEQAEAEPATEKQEV